MHCSQLLCISRHYVARGFVTDFVRTVKTVSLGQITQRETLELKEDWQWAKPEGHNTGVEVKNSYHCTRKNAKHETVPLIVPNPHHVTWYACGPTVYDSSHIGHASTYINFDLIRRILTKYFGLHICMVMGITNMDNKIINRALLYDRDFMEVADTYEAEFKRDMKLLNVLPPTTYVRVTDIIPQIIAFIQKLIDQKQAYVTESGNIYFSYNSAHQSVAKLAKEFFEPDTAARGEKLFEKDMSLWKTPNAGEPYWDSPWGKGRPGWHIECSVMASMCFGRNVDIHSGATDLQFPHHEYEIAQCDAYHGCHQWINYFLHSGHMVVKDGKKMSKSLKNFITISEFIEKCGEPDVLRLMCCNHYWNKRYEFSMRKAEIHKEQLDNINEFLKWCRSVISGKSHVTVDDVVVLEALANCQKEILLAFKKNFKVLDAMQSLRELPKIVYKSSKETETVFLDNSTIVKVTDFVETFLDNLGFTFHRKQS